MSGRSDECFFVGIAHEFNSGIGLYCLINESTITRHSYEFLDIATRAFNTPLSSEPISINNSFSSPEEAGPTSLDAHVS